MDPYNTIWNQIKIHAQRENRNVADIFDHYDTSRTGMCSIQDFQEAFKAMYVRIEEKKFNKLVRELDTTRDGTIDLEELVRRINGEPKQSPIKKIQEQPNHWANLVFQKIKVYLETNNVHIQDLFDQFDRDRDQYISRNDFNRLLKQSIKIDISDKELNDLMDILDFDGDGNISYIEFVNVINSYQLPKSATQTNLTLGSARTAEWAEKYFVKIREYLDERQTTIGELFRDCDLDQNNTLSGIEFLG